MAVNHARNLSIRDEFNGVGTTRVFSDADIVVVRNTGDGIVDNILEDATKSDSVVDIGFLLCRKVNAFSVASALNVEDTGVRPNVFVVADQKTVGIRRKSRLPSARETEEEGDITILDPNVGRRVKRKLPEFDRL